MPFCGDFNFTLMVRKLNHPHSPYMTRDPALPQFVDPANGLNFFSHQGPYISNGFSALTQVCRPNTQNAL